MKKVFERFKSWAEHAELKKVHRILFAFTLVVFGIAFALSIVFNNPPTEAPTDAYRKLMQHNYQEKAKDRQLIDSPVLAPGNYHIFGANYDNLQHPFFFVAHPSGGILVAVEVPAGVNIPTNEKDCLHYTLDIAQDGAWTLRHIDEVNSGNNTDMDSSQEWMNH
ncbi:MAG: hypothetical protein WCS30_12790, partial [Selenomonadaceae bacterium]